MNALRRSSNQTVSETIGLNEWWSRRTMNALHCSHRGQVFQKRFRCSIHVRHSCSTFYAPRGIRYKDVTTIRHCESVSNQSQPHTSFSAPYIQKDESITRAAVGMGIPMGIPMGMCMVWVWGLWWIPMGSVGILWGFLNGCNLCGIETNSTNSEFVFFHNFYFFLHYYCYVLV